ncbi:DUF7221 family queuine tRNA-ribosyltransferase-like protein [Kitasatospora griseola]|uniref:deazapurine DNA modification protein DpdA family protein n=1 Tax=Kitasatospora griseola TaxID=2064 RepID=UPI003412068A
MARRTPPGPAGIRAVPEPRRTVFYLGAPPNWAQDSEVPLMLSANALMNYRLGPRSPLARCRFAVDSAGFSQVGKHGDYLLDADGWGGMVYRLMDRFGAPPEFASCQDFMCEPQITARTGFTVAQHQEFTVDSYLYLVEQFPAAPWLPVLQGQRVEEYLEHLAMYEAAGVDLAALPLVGVGSVCRRQGTKEAGHILAELAGRGLALHGFGLKVAGLRAYGHLLASADSYAWSYGARRRRVRLAECTHRAADCRTCRRYALLWRDRVLSALDAPKQLELCTITN